MNDFRIFATSQNVNGETVQDSMLTSGLKKPDLFALQNVCCSLQNVGALEEARKM